MKERSIEEIRKKVAEGTAVVMTAHEICQLTMKNKPIKFEDVDVVTTATKGLMSGTSAIMAFRVGQPKEFIKIKSLTMNGIPCYVGPCPNETLGLVDLILYATDKSKENPSYGAGHLLRELVEGKPVSIHAITIEGKQIEKTITLNDIYFAQMMGIRHAFRNYSAFINPSQKPIESIFTVVPMAPNSTEISFCGCGAVNPLENDPNFEILGIGSPILLNGAQGYIIGSGTRSSPQRPNLMTIAPLFDMVPDYMGGFITANGPEVICTIAAAIPIINERVFENLAKTDKFVKLNIVDIVGRNVLTTSDYGKVWRRNLAIIFKPEYCPTCELNHDCPVVRYCPTSCFSLQEGIDRSKCFNCGTCKKVCPKLAFQCDLGEIEIDGRKVPVTLRQSDRNGAIKAMEDLKARILKKIFPLSLPTARPIIYTENMERKRDHEGN